MGKAKKRALTGHPKSCQCGGNAMLYPSTPAPGVPMAVIPCPGPRTPFIAPKPSLSGQDRAAGEGAP